MFAATVAACLLLIACGDDGGGTASGGGDETEAELKPIQEMSVTVDDTGATLDAESIEAAPVEVSVQNDSKGPYHLSFAKLNEGVTLEEVEKNIQSEKVLEMITVAGSVTDAAESGGSTSITMQFPEGEYIALDPEAQLAFAPFTVVAAEGEYETPEADHKIDLGEFYFEIPGSIPAGPATFAVTNSGEQSHEVSFGLVEGGSEEGEGFMLAPAPGGTAWAEFDLEAGDYQAVCFFPDMESGKPHIKLGMKAEFTVE